VSYDMPIPAKTLFVAEQAPLSKDAPTVWYVGESDDPDTVLTTLPSPPPFKLRGTFTSDRKGLCNHVHAILDMYRVRNGNGFYEIPCDKVDEAYKSIGEEVAWWSETAKVYGTFSQLNPSEPPFDDDEAEEVDYAMTGNADLMQLTAKLRNVKTLIKLATAKKDVLETRIKVHMLQHTLKCDTIDLGEEGKVTWKWQERTELDKKELEKRVAPDVIDACRKTKRIRVMRTA